MKQRGENGEPDQVTEARKLTLSALELISHLKNQRHWDRSSNPDGLRYAEQDLRNALDHLAVWQ